jgi:hypothetical protein
MVRTSRDSLRRWDDMSTEKGFLAAFGGTFGVVLALVFMVVVLFLLAFTVVCAGCGAGLMMLETPPPREPVTIEEPVEEPADDGSTD